MSSSHLAAYAFAALAIVVMAIDVVLALRLRKSLAGGEVGQKWRLLTALLAFFLIGYVVAPLALVFQLGAEVISILAFGVFLLGAVFVWLVIGILRDTLAFLDLLKG